MIIPAHEKWIEKLKLETIRKREVYKLMHKKCTDYKFYFSDEENQEMLKAAP